jgi:hypothetical protein
VSRVVVVEGEGGGVGAVDALLDHTEGAVVLPGDGAGDGAGHRDGLEEPAVVRRGQG